MRIRHNPFLPTFPLIAATMVFAGLQSASATDYNIDASFALGPQTFTWTDTGIWDPDSAVGGPGASDNIVITGLDLDHVTAGTNNPTYAFNYEVAPNAAASRSIQDITVTDALEADLSGAQIRFNAGVAGSTLTFSDTTPTVSTNIINRNSGGNHLGIQNPLFQAASTFTKNGAGNVRLEMLDSSSVSSFNDNIASITSTGGSGSLWLSSANDTTNVSLPPISFNTTNTGLVLTSGIYTATDKAIALGTGRLSMGGPLATLNLEGTTTISTGTVVLGSNNSGEYYMGGSATINLNSAGATFNAIDMGSQKDSAGTITVNQMAGVTNLTSTGGVGFIGAPNNSNFTGTRAQTLSLNVSGGSFNFTGAGAAQDWPVGRNVRGTTTTTGLYTLNGSVNVSGSGTLDLGSRVRMVLGTDTSSKADNTNATLNLNGGTLRTAKEIARGNNDNNLGTDSTRVYLNGGNLQTTAAIAELFLNFGSTATNGVFVSSGGAVIDTNGLDSGTAAVMQENTASTGGGLTKNGAGILTLNGASTFGGTTTINGGTLLLGNALALQNSTFNSNGAGTLNFGILSAATVGGLTGAGNLSLENAIASAVALTVSGAQSSSYAGSLSGAGSLIKAGAGTLTLTGANSYSGTTSVNGGVLAVSTVGALPGYDTAGKVSVANNASLVVGNGVSDADITTILTNGTFAAGSAIGFDTSAGNRSYSGTVPATLGLTKIGENTLTLTTAQTNTGATRIWGGTLALGASGDNQLAATGTLFIGGESTLDLNGSNQTFSNISLGAGSYTASIIDGGNLTVQGGTGNLNFSPAQTTIGQTAYLNMSGLASFTYNDSTKAFQVGAGGPYGNVFELSLSSATNTITANSLALNMGSTTGNGTWPFNGGILKLGQTNTFNLGNGTGICIALSGYRSSGNQITFQNAPASSNLKIRAADGTSRAGGIAVSAGSSGTGAAQPITASFDLGVADALVGDIILADTVQIGSGANITGTMTMDGGTLDATSMVLGKVSAGTNTPTNINTLLGSFTQNLGTTILGTLTFGNVIAAGPQSTGTLPRFDATYTLGNGAVLVAGTINANPGGLSFRDTSVRTLNINGGKLTNIPGGNLTVSGADATAAGLLNIALGGTNNTIEATSGQTIDIQATAPISGSGNLIKTGLGTLSLKGANTYSGETLVDAGTLEITTDDTLADGHAVRLASGTTLNLAFTGEDTVDRLFINGVERASGTWGSLASSATHKSALITGDGILAVTNGSSVTNNFATWASLNGVTGGPNGDSDNDGIRNLVEYALADGTRGTLTGNTLSFTKRGAPWGSDITYDIETSSTLASWTTLAKPPVTETAGSISYILPTGAGKVFARLKVVEVP